MKVYKNFTPQIVRLGNDKNFSLIAVQPKDCLDEKHPCWSKVLIFQKPKDMNYDDYMDCIRSLKIDLNILCKEQ